jgi:hypothetical protein
MYIFSFLSLLWKLTELKWFLWSVKMRKDAIIQLESDSQAILATKEENCPLGESVPYVMSAKCCKAIPISKKCAW